MVLCAGYGTRLRPLTDELPKALLPFGDRSLLEHAVLAVTRAGLGTPIVNSHHLHDVFVREIQDLGLPIEVVYEPEIRGTAGGVFGVRSRFGPAPIVVLNGDAVFDQVPNDFADLARDMCLVLAVLPRAREEGTVGIGDSGQVVRLRGETFGKEVSGGDYIGLCAIGERGLDALPEFGCLVQDFALPLLRRGEWIGTYALHSEVWLPGDDLTGYLRDNLQWLSRRAGGGSIIGASAFVAPEIELVQSVIAPRAEIVGVGSIARSVVCSGARIEAPLADAIVTPSGRVILPGARG